LPLAEFAVGIEAANYCSFIVLIISYVVQTVFRFSKRDWTLISAFIIGVVLPMIMKMKFGRDKMEAKN
jgi:hypothetical protein